MTLKQETIAFLYFILIGFICCFIFDFFRALRKNKKTSKRIVELQDIIYFLIIGVILFFIIYAHMQDRLRISIFLEILLGVWLYIVIIGNKVITLYLMFFGISRSFLKFIFLPFDIIKQPLSKHVKNFKKYVIYCCKKIFNMICFLGKKKLNVRKRFVWQEKVQCKKREKKLN